MRLELHPIQQQRHHLIQKRQLITKKLKNGILIMLGHLKNFSQNQHTQLRFLQDQMLQQNLKLMTVCIDGMAHQPKTQICFSLKEQTKAVGECLQWVFLLRLQTWKSLMERLA